MKLFFIASLLLLKTAQASVPVAFTIDDLPSHGAPEPGMTLTQMTRGFLATLSRHGVTDATSFLNGRGAEGADGMQALREWVAAGQPIANHGYSHLDLNGVLLDRYFADLERNVPVIESLGTKKLWKFFRYPNLHEGETASRRKAVRDYLFRNGYQIGHVTIDTADWAFTAPYSRCRATGNASEIEWMKREYLENAVQAFRNARRLARTLAGREIRQIVLVHGSAFQLQVIDSLISSLKREGATFIPLDQALQDPIYQRDTGWVSESGRTFLDQLLWVRSLGLVSAYPQPYLDHGRLERICR